MWAQRAAKLSPLSIASWNFPVRKVPFTTSSTSVIKYIHDTNIQHSGCILLIICNWIKQATRVNKQFGIETHWFLKSSFYEYPYNSTLNSKLKAMIEESTDNRTNIE